MSYLRKLKIEQYEIYKNKHILLPLVYSSFAEIERI
jgi:hypothetical protein